MCQGIDAYAVKPTLVRAVVECMTGVIADRCHQHATSMVCHAGAYDPTVSRVYYAV
jgi:hypothetical protein